MEVLNQKDFKDKLNETLYCSSNDNSEIVNDMDQEDFSSSQSVEDDAKKSLENIIKKCKTVLTMGENAKKKTQVIEKQFQGLKQKLDSNSRYLEEMKSEFGKLNFLYQKKALEVCKLIPSSCLESDFIYTRGGMAENIEDTRKKIYELRHLPHAQEEKQRTYNSYREVLKQVFDHFQEIDNDVYNVKLSN